YQYEQRVKQEAEQEGKEYNPVTYYGQKNAEIKKYNEQFADVIHLEDYKTKRDYKSELNQLRKHMHVDERNVEATNLLVDRIKGYVDYKSSSKLYHDFTSNQNKWKLKIERSSVMNNVHEKLLNNIKEQHKKNPDFVKKFGYSIDNFESEMNKEYNIIMTEDKIKKEMKNQDKYNENQRYTPTWKQAKDLMTSINSYDRTINKLSKQNTDKATPEEMKDTIIKIQSYKELKEN